MKIYASRKTPELKDFLGKNIWVKVRRNNIGSFYIKVLDIQERANWEPGDYNGPTIRYNAVSSTYFDNNPTLLASDDPYVTHEWVSDLANIQLILPLDILSEDELLSSDDHFENEPFEL